MAHRDAAFKRRLIEAMDAARIRPTALADRLGVHATTVSRWRAGEIPEAGTLTALASALAVRVDWLKTGKGERTVREAPPGRYQAGNGARGPGTAARFYRAIIRQLSADFGQGETVSVEEAASYVQALWNYATEECPALEQDIEPDAD